MILTILWILCYFSLFYGADYALSKTKLDGIYYLMHSVHNAAIVAYTAPDVYNSITNFSHISTYEVNSKALQLCFALHLYHIARYVKKFRTDDWLHHGLMIGVALPIGGIVPAGSLLGYSLFFTTGLPGGIDYFLLFLNRNNWLHRQTEKRINTFLNVWIRSPGTVSLATLIAVFLCTTPNIPTLHIAGGVITAALNYWNGQYFMQQVVLNLATHQALLQ